MCRRLLKSRLWPHWRAISTSIVLALVGAASGATAFSNEAPQATEPPVTARESLRQAPWRSIARTMETTGRRVAAGDLGKDTQASQRDVVAQLDALIDAYSAAQQAAPPSAPNENANSQTSNPSKQPGKNGSTTGDGQAAGPNSKERPLESVERHGNAAAQSPDGKPRITSSAEEFWGRLPPHLRQKVPQSATGRVPPKYQAAVEEYFRRLLEADRSR
jgi:hypothetical protein